LFTELATPFQYRFTTLWGRLVRLGRVKDEEANLTNDSINLNGRSFINWLDISDHERLDLQ
jgi:hypothetical protein